MKTSERTSLLSRLVASVITTVIVTVLNGTSQVAQAAPASQERVQRGAYLARAGNCIACHTAREGQSFAGGRPMNTPVGLIYSTNVTPDLETGTGGYTMDDSMHVMREGVAKDGHYLYPAMPYTSYTKVSQEDLLALYTYFMQGVEPVRQANRPTQLPWPFSMRSIMAVWNALYLQKGEYVADQDKSASWNRGAYLVQGLGHCGACHTPRGIAGQEKAGSEKDGRQYLSGATLDNWYASPLTGDPETGLHAWSKNEIVDYLRTGRTARVAALGVMAEVVGKSTQYLTDPDLQAIAEYLKSLPPVDNERQSNTDSIGQVSDASATTRALRAGDTGIRGSGVYLDNCNACHRSDGTGATRTFPNLVKNEAVNAGDPITLIRIIVEGTSMPSTDTAPSAIAMPGLGWRLSDEEVTDVLNFIRGSWGNRAAAVSRGEVGRVRQILAVQKECR